MPCACCATATPTVPFSPKRCCSGWPAPERAMEEETTSGAPTETVSVAGVQFRYAGQIHEYDAGALPLSRGDRVLVQVSRGTDLGTIAAPPKQMPADDVRRTLPRILRKADARELAREQLSLQRARDAERICSHRVRERDLNMKLIKA